MLLAIDVGNSNTVFGVFRGTELVDYWRIESRESRTGDEYGMLFRQLFDAAGFDIGDVKAVIVSCVVPPLLGTLERMCERYFGVRALVVGPGMKTGMPIRYDNPKEVGADRIVNAVAAYDRFSSAVVIVDFGTATTFDAVDKDGAYLGGAITPGITISNNALFHHASKLPRVEVAKPGNVVGRNTVESLQSGIFYGCVAMVDGIVERIKGEVGDDVRVVATGGLAELIAKESVTIEEVLPLLTLDGLRIIFERNR